MIALTSTHGACEVAVNDTRRRFRYFGPDTELTPVARLIMSEDVAGLEQALGRDWELNEPIQICPHCTALAIELALAERKYAVVDYLLSKKADLNVPGAPAITSAVHTRDTRIIDKILAAGADIRAENNVGYNALTQAVTWEYFELLPYLEAKGLTARKFGQEALDCAVFDGHLEFVEYLLTRGVSPRFNGRDGARGTPLHSAAQNGNLKMAKLLVRYGAEPTQPNAHAQRPYLLALANDDDDLAAYLRGLEPAKLHDRARLELLARAHRAPSELIEALAGADRKLGTAPDGEPVVELLALDDLYEFRWARRRYVALSLRSHDVFTAGQVVWSRKRQCVCAIDIDHDELFELGAWRAFADDPLKCMERIWAAAA